MRYVGNRTMSASGGYISGGGVAPGDIDMDGNRIHDSAGPLNLGADATTGHSLTAGDVLVGGKLEVDGPYCYIDGRLTITNYGGISLSATSVFIHGDSYITPRDQYVMAISSSQDRILLLTDQSNWAKDHGLSAAANPGLRVFSVTDPTAGDATQYSALDWNRLGLGGPGGGLGCVNQTISYSDFVDGGGLTGTLDLDEGIPDGAVVIQAILHTLTGFTGGANAAATVTIGDGTDVDRYNTGTPSVFTTNASGCDLGVPSGTKWHDDAKTVTVTVTVDNDFSTITAGACAVALFYFTP